MEIIQKFSKIDMVQLCDDLFLHAVHDIKGKDGVNFVDAGAGHKTVHIFQMFLVKQLPVCPVPTVNRHIGQGIHKLFAAFHILFDDGHADIPAGKELSQIITRSPTANDHDVFRFIRLDPDFAEKFLYIAGHSHDGKDITAHDDRIPIRDNDLAVAFNDADEQIICCQLGQLL